MPSSIKRPGIPEIKTPDFKDGIHALEAALSQIDMLVNSNEQSRQFGRREMSEEVVVNVQEDGGRNQNGANSLCFVGGFLGIENSIHTATAHSRYIFVYFS